MVENLYPFVDIAENWPTIASYLPNNQTYDVTNIVKGSGVDLLHSLENLLNFTTRLYKRKDGKWGMPKTLPNGTTILNGMIKSITESKSNETKKS